MSLPGPNQLQSPKMDLVMDKQIIFHVPWYHDIENKLVSVIPMPPGIQTVFPVAFSLQNFVTVKRGVKIFQ